MAGKADYKVTAEAFVSAWLSAWEASETVQEVSARTGMPVDIVYSRASEYRRKHGIRLPPLRRVTRKRLDVQALNHLAEKLEREKRAREGEGDKPSAGSVRGRKQMGTPEEEQLKKVVAKLLKGRRHAGQ